MKRDPFKVEIEVDVRGCGKIIVDGQEIRRVRRVTLEAGAGDVTEVHLVLIPDLVHVRAEAGVMVEQLERLAVALDKTADAQSLHTTGTSNPRPAHT